MQTMPATKSVGGLPVLCLSGYPELISWQYVLWISAGHSGKKKSPLCYIAEQSWCSDQNPNKVVEKFLHKESVRR